MPALNIIVASLALIEDIEVVEDSDEHNPVAVIDGVLINAEEKVIVAVKSETL